MQMLKLWIWMKFLAIRCHKKTTLSHVARFGPNSLKEEVAHLAKKPSAPGALVSSRPNIQIFFRARSDKERTRHPLRLPKIFFEKKNISFIWHRPLKLEMKTTEHVSRDLIEPPSWMRISRHPLANELDLWCQLGTIDGQWTAPHLCFCLRPRKFFVPGVCVSRSCPPFLAAQRLLGSTWTQKMASTTFHQLPIDV